MLHTAAATISYMHPLDPLGFVGGGAAAWRAQNCTLRLRQLGRESRPDQSLSALKEIQEEPGGDRRSQEEPGGVRRSQNDEFCDAALLICFMT